MQRKVMLGAAVVVISMLLAACVQPYSGNTSGPKVAVIGDSITALTDEEFHRELDPYYGVSITGVSGATVEDMQAKASSYALGYAAVPPDDPDVVVINLGSNNAGRLDWVDGVVIQLLGMAEKFTGKCVVMTTINTHTAVSWFNAWAVQLNQHIRRATHVVDWDAIVGNDPYGLTVDTLHPNQAGQDALAKATARQVRDCL